MSEPPPPPPSPAMPPPPVPYGGAQPTNGMAIASLVCGIVGFLCFVPAVVAIVLGAIARTQISQTEPPQKGQGMATAGMILGTVWIALTVVYFVIFFVAEAS